MRMDWICNLQASKRLRDHLLLFTRHSSCECVLFFFFFFGSYGGVFMARVKLEVYHTALTL